MNNTIFKVFCDGAGVYHIFTYSKRGNVKSAYHTGIHTDLRYLLNDIIEYGDTPDNCDDSDYEGISKKALHDDNEFLDDIESKIIADNDGVYVDDWNYKDLGVSHDYVDNTLSLELYLSQLNQAV